jgi:hypothetical protein
MCARTPVVPGIADTTKAVDNKESISDAVKDWRKYLGIIKDEQQIRSETQEYIKRFDTNDPEDAKRIETINDSMEHLITRMYTHGGVRKKKGRH